jgi:hypothetical protein
VTRRSHLTFFFLPEAGGPLFSRGIGARAVGTRFARSITPAFEDVAARVDSLLVARAGVGVGGLALDLDLVLPL